MYCLELLGLPVSLSPLFHHFKDQLQSCSQRPRDCDGKSMDSLKLKARILRILRIIFRILRNYLIISTMKKSPNRY